MKCTELDCVEEVYSQAPSKGLCRRHYRCLLKNGTTKSKYDLDKYSDLGGIKDPNPGRRGSLAVNIVNDIKFKARQRKKEWNLTHQQAFTIIISPCNYCGFIPTWPENRVGIDRVDAGIGYHIENCVPSCFRCNSAKNDMSTEEFKAHIKKIYLHLFGK